MLTPANLGQRIVTAARLAMTLHREAEFLEAFQAVQQSSSVGMQNFGRPAVTSGAVSGLFTDDTPSEANRSRSPWTQAGENPAGSFHF